MRRPRPSTLVWRSLEGFLTTFVDKMLLGVGVSVGVVVGVVEVEELLAEGGEIRVLDCMEMEPMKGPWGWGWLDPGVGGSG